MKKVIAALILITLFSIFCCFLIQMENAKEVLKVITPTKIGVDFDKNKIIDNNEIICINDIESFSLEPTEEFYRHYSKALKLNRTDIISLGYLAQDFAEKTLLNKKVRVKFTPKSLENVCTGKLYLTILTTKAY